MNTSVTVRQDNLDDRIFVTLDDVTFSASNLFGIPSIHFFLTPDVAERLQSFLNSTLEDAQRAREDQDHKYREEPVRTEE